MVEKGEKVEKEEKEVKKERGRGGGRTFLQVIILILVIALIWLMLIVIQVPYITTNAVKEMVPMENCTHVDIPFAANFRTGLNYDGATEIYSSNGQALYRYSELQPYLFANIINTGEDKGVYCLNAQAYLIKDFTNQASSLSQFQNMIAENSDQIQQIDNWSGNSYNYPVCTEKPISPIDTKIISLWKPALLSNNLGEQVDLKNVYILFTVVPAVAEKCSTISVENITQQEVTRYCNAWKHVVGRC
jgi:hypothetical protein